MEKYQALEALGALSQNTRLEVFRLLVQHEPAGLPAGDIARALGVPHNTLSSHLNILARAGLISAQRHSRSIVYRAAIPHLRDLVLFLVKDCCNGDPSLCGPLVTVLKSCCQPEPVA